MSEDPEGKKNRAFAIDGDLHQHIKLIAIRQKVSMKELVERPLRALVEENREWLEQVTEEAIAR